jgi:hypothetical protein
MENSPGGSGGAGGGVAKSEREQQKLFQEIVKNSHRALSGFV